MGDGEEPVDSDPTVDAELPAAFAAPACLGCGACCFSPSERYVRVFGRDWKRLGAEVERWAVFHDHRAYLRMVDGHCAALRIRPAVSDGSRAVQFECAIYEHRPQTCRDLGRGSPACEAEWLRKRRTAARAASE